MFVKSCSVHTSLTVDQYMIISGGFAESTYVFESIKQKFADHDIVVMKSKLGYRYEMSQLSIVILLTEA